MKLSYYKRDKILSRFCIFALLVGACFCIYHLNLSVVVRPNETYFRQLPLVKKYFDGTLRFRELLTRYGEHGMLAENILMLINAAFFNLSDVFEAGIAIVCIALSGYVIFLMVKDSVLVSNNSFYWAFPAIGVIWMIFYFNNSYAFGMNNQVRMSLLFSLFSIFGGGKLFRDNNVSALLGMIILIFASLNIFGTFYSMAVIPFICLVAFMQALRKSKRERYTGICVIAAYVLAVFLHLYEYKFLTGSASGTGLLSVLLDIVANPVQTVKCILGWCASGLLGYNAYYNGDVKDVPYLAAGFILFCLYCYACIRFFKIRMYKITWAPLFLMGYSSFLLLEVMLGRPGEWQRYIGAWYNIHAKMLPVACIWILGYDQSIQKTKKYRIVMLIVYSMISFFAILGSFYSLKVAPFAKDLEKNATPYLFAQNVDELNVLDENGLTPLLETPELTMEGIETMREHELGVYQYEKAYKDMERLSGRATGTKLSEASMVSGIFDDGWASQNSSLCLQASDSGIIVLEGFYPLPPTGNESIAVSVNGEKMIDYVIQNQEFQVNIPVPPNEKVTLSFYAPFSGKNEESKDNRDLAFFINELYALS